MNLDYLIPFANQCDIDQISKIVSERSSWKNRNHSINYTQVLSSLPNINSAQICISEDKVTVKKDITEECKQVIKTACIGLIPWRKGPFDLFDIEIDAEWRSDLKWNRIASSLGDLKDKTIMDIGCNNGYFMFKMLNQNPKLVLGIDPVVHCQSQFDLVQHFIQAQNIKHEMLGVEHLNLFHEMFDVILSMGIIYHHRHPIQQLLDLKNALKPGGTAIIETIGIPGKDSTALFPEDRYAKMRNVWFVPTLSCLINWANRAKFSNIEVISDTLLTQEEQRITKWSPQQSLKDFLNPNDLNQTIEGYPAPRRFCIKVTKLK
ncbi:MAG: tRNA 5-methoxyuridine(34)/uridine 5-oxyacetic acid(34) synthase CmoB [Bdellovibrionales bacterium]|nr:tRNA 5-methoxyuridine(34)/uridine 5-oxyacetic acid(34) synthase CmoB [Bdellovibrionales bacterium]